MNLLTEAMGGLGGAVLSLVAALLFEELTIGGLVRLVMACWCCEAPRPEAFNQKGCNTQKGEGR